MAQPAFCIVDTGSCLFERQSPDFALSLEQGKGRQGVLHHLLQGVAELDIMYLGENNSLCVFRISPVKQVVGDRKFQITCSGRRNHLLCPGPAP